MRYAHVFQISNALFSTRFISFIQRFFSRDEHVFFVNKTTYDATKELENTIHIDFTGNLQGVLSVLNKFDKVWIHGMFIEEFALQILQYPDFLNKCIWVIWGGELYAGSSAMQQMRSLVAQHSMGIVTFTKDDYTRAVEKFGPPRWHSLTFYPNPLEINTSKVDYSSNEIKNIMVGHSASVSNRHIETLERYKEFRFEDKRIFIPLSYGPKANALAVEDWARKHRNLECVIVKEIMQSKQFIAFLNRMDAALMPQLRQSGLSTLYALLALGKPTFVASQVVRDHLHRQFGIIIPSLEDFARFSTGEYGLDFMKETVSKAQIMFNENWIAGIWEKLFDFKPLKELTFFD